MKIYVFSNEEDKWKNASWTSIVSRFKPFFMSVLEVNCTTENLTLLYLMFFFITRIKKGIAIMYRKSINLQIEAWPTLTLHYSAILPPCITQSQFPLTLHQGIKPYCKHSLHFINKFLLDCAGHYTGNITVVNCYCLDNFGTMGSRSRSRGHKEKKCG